MRSFTISQVLVFSLPLALVACSHENDQRSARAPSGYEAGMTPASGTMTPASTPSTSTTTPSSPSASSDQGLTDGQIAAVVRASNVAEIDQAKIAVGKARDAGVKHFAEMMIAQHGQAVKDVDELDTRLNLRPTESQLMTELRVNATSVENRLSKNDEPSFDKQYMQSQLDAHRQLLDTIDSRLMPAVRSEELRGMLANLRPRVADHLQMAQTILDNLK
jgi:putative membrane protein